MTAEAQVEVVAVDPCDPQRRERDRLSDRLSRAVAAYDYANERVGYYCDLAEQRQPTAEQVQWIEFMRNELTLEGVSANIFPTGTPLGSTIWKWAGSRARASYAINGSELQPGLQARFEAAQQALADCEGVNDGMTVPAPPPPPVVPPADDDAADELLNQVGSAGAIGNGRLLCGMPRTGHGHEGEPCRMHTHGGACHYHGGGAVPAVLV